MTTSYRRVAAAMLFGLVAGATVSVSPSAGQATSLPNQVSPVGLRFAGHALSGSSPDQVFERNDVATLVAASQPVTFNELIRHGIPARSSRLQQLMDWGLLTQTDMSFVSRIPILRGESAEAFWESLRRTLPPLVSVAADEIQAIRDALPEHHRVPALPALVEWILRERVWFHVTGPAGADLSTLVTDHRSQHPDRGWWGVLWYVEQPPVPLQPFYTARRGDYTLAVAWDAGVDADPFRGPDREREVQRFLSRLDDDGRELDDHEEFPTLASRGLVGPGDRINAAASRWRIDRDSFARRVEQAAVTITEAVVGRLPLPDLAARLGTTPTQALVVAYAEMVPLIVEELRSRGVLVELPQPEGQGEVGDGEEFSLRERLPQLANGERSSEVTDGGQEEGEMRLPHEATPFSAFIWHGASEPPAFEFPR